jgi:AraC-like DNA-binding protein
MRTPPASIERRSANDLDEVRAAFERFGTSRRDCLGRGRFQLSWASTDLGGATVAWVESSLPQRVVATSQVHLLHVPLAAPLTYRVGARHFEAIGRRAMCLRPGVEFTVTYGAESPAFVLAFDEQVLGGRAEGRGSAEAMEIPIAEQAMARLTHELQALWNPGGVIPGGREAAHLRNRLSTWMADLLPRGDPARIAGHEAPARVRRVEDWIDAHLAEPVELGDLCRIAGIEDRGLRKSFQQRRGMSPMQWLGSRRMAAARMRLLAAAPGETVTSIALDCGLLHPGRFAVAYRRRYGESPSTTLVRAQSRD